MVEVGRKAPGFAAEDGTGETVELSDLKGRRVVLYFYPRDDTAGCTKEACGFRDLHDRFAAANAVVIGVSPDSARSHERFRDEHGLPFPLLVDADHAVASAYGAWGQKKFMGREFEGIIRSTFLIDEAGRVAAAWPKVKVAGHPEAVLAAVEGAGAAPAPSGGSEKKTATKKKAAQKKAAQKKATKKKAAAQKKATKKRAAKKKAAPKKATKKKAAKKKATKKAAKKKKASR